MAWHEESIGAVTGVTGDRSPASGGQAELLASVVSVGVGRRTSGDGVPDAGWPSRAPDMAVTITARLEAAQAELNFERDESTGEMVVQLKNPKTGEVIRQIPPPEMLKIAEAINRYLGLFVDRQS